MATVLASGTAFLLGSAVGIALPAIQKAFSTDISGLQWVADAYLLSLASLLLIGGSLGDRFGRKRTFLAGIASFGAAALASGLSHSITALIVFQAIEGIAAAVMVPQSLAIINVAFAEESRGQVIGLWAGISGAMGVLGPWAGGWLVQSFGWQAVYFLVVPFAAAAFAITLLFVPESRSPQTRRLDWTGTILIFTGLFGIAYGLITGSGGWTRPEVLAALAGGAVLLVLFIFFERRQPNALVPFRIFKNPFVSGANLATLTLYFALNGITFFCVLDLQQVQGFSPLAAGLALLPVSVLITFLSGPAGRLSDRIGPRLQMIAGPGLVGLGAALLMTGSFHASYIMNFFPGLALIGGGMALVIAPLTKSALAVQPELSGAASGVNNAAARIAALLAVAMLGAIIAALFAGQLRQAIAASGLPSAEAQQILDQTSKVGGITIPDSFNAADRVSAKAAVGTSFIFAFRWAMGICAALSFAAAGIAAAMIKNPKRGPLPNRGKNE
jgi:EmrB/QacA subfamily drug resistance transporter